MASVQSAEGFTKRLTALAYSAVGKEPPAQEQTAGVPLVPIYVGIDTDHAGQQQQLRETFIYRLGDAKWGVKSATSRFLLETGQPGGHTEKNVEEMIKAGLKPYANMQGTGKQQLVKLQFYVRNGDQVFRDEVLWDVGNPVYDAQTYAVRVCTALGLEADWFDAIRTHVQQQLDDVRQDLSEAPQDIELQQPVKKARRTDAAAVNGCSSSSSSKQEGVPRIEAYDPAHDVEARRVAARQLKLQQRQKIPQAPGAAAAMQRPQQVSPQLQQQQGQQGAPQRPQQVSPQLQGPGMQPPQLSPQPTHPQVQQPMPQQQVPGPGLQPPAQPQQAAQQLPAQLQALQQQQQQQQSQQTPQQQQQQQQMLQQLQQQQQQQQQHIHGAHGHLHGQPGMHMSQQAHVQQARLHHVPPGQVPGHLQAAHLLQQQPPQQHVPVGLPQQHLQQPHMPHQQR